jgi:hypothetical protein
LDFSQLAARSKVLALARRARQGSWNEQLLKFPR